MPELERVNQQLEQESTSLRTVVLMGLLLALPAIVQAERLPIKTYTTADGLARDHINRIVQDSRGFLWFCTMEGLSRFDGYQFTNYSTDQGPPRGVVTDLLETRSGVYWVATGDGVCQFNPKGSASRISDNIHNPQLKGSQSRIRDSSGPMFDLYHPSGDKAARGVNVLIEDHRGTVWCGTGGGLYWLKQAGNQVEFHFAGMGMPAATVDDRIVETILEDRRGALWVGTRGSGLYRRLSDGRVERYTTRHGLPSNGVMSLLEDRDGQLWVGTTQGLCLLVPEPDLRRPVVARVYTAKDGLGSNWTRSLLQSSDGRLWVGSSGLSEFLPAAKEMEPKFRTYTTAHGLSDTSVWALAEDWNGNLWIGTESGGAMKIVRNGFTTYSEVDGLSSHRIASIIENHAGDLCVISSQTDGLIINRFDGRRFIAIRPNLPQRITYLGWGWYQITFQDSTGEWWVPTGQGLCRFPRVSRVEQLAHARPKAIYTTRDGLTGENVFRLYEDSRGDIRMC